MIILRTAIAAVAAVGLVPPAAAQVPPPAAPAQTPANAQKFLQLVFGQGSTTTSTKVQVRRDMDSGWNCNGGSYTCYENQTRDGKIAWVSGTGCTTNIVVYLTGSTSWRGYHSSDYITNTAPRIAITWGSVSDVKVSGTTVSLAGFDQIGSLYFATADTAARVGKAMKVLQVACDPTRGTGF